jgi:transcriptional regulator with XRE-family HTH domain
MFVLGGISLEAIATLGQNIEIARCRRGLSKKLLCERAMITPQTYRRLITGDPGISLGVVFSVCQAMNLEPLLSELLAPEHDEAGKALENTLRKRYFRGTPGDALDTDF